MHLGCRGVECFPRYRVAVRRSRKNSTTSIRLAIILDSLLQPATTATRSEISCGNVEYTKA